MRRFASGARTPAHLDLGLVRAALWGRRRRKPRRKTWIGWKRTKAEEERLSKYPVSSACDPRLGPSSTRSSQEAPKFFARRLSQRRAQRQDMAPQTETTRAKKAGLKKKCTYSLPFPRLALQLTPPSRRQPRVRSRQRAHSSVQHLSYPETNALTIAQPRRPRPRHITRWVDFAFRQTLAADPSRAHST